MASLPDGYRAVVIGASGGIGGAIVDALHADPRCAHVAALHRRSAIPIDFDDEATIARASRLLAATGPFSLIVNAIGVLHDDGLTPEKRLADLDYARLSATFRVNTFGPALVLRHFAPLLGPDRALMAFLSAKVGSIGDNRLGGWYGYRASKAALNMLVRTAAVELARVQPRSIVVALHPGTVDTRLSRPFGGAVRGRSPSIAAAELLRVLDGLTADDSGGFRAYDGAVLPW